MRHTRYRRVAGGISTVVLAVILTILLMIQLPSMARADENHVGFDMTVVAADGEDVSILGADVFVNAQDAGDISIAAGDVEIDGTARGDVSVAGGDISITGAVGGDLSVAGGDLTISSDVQGEVSLAGGDVTFSGSSDDDAHLIGGSVSLDGTFSEDLYVATDHFTITPGSVIHGDFEFRGPNEPVLPEGLTIHGAYTYEYSDLDDVFDGEIPVIVFPVIAIAGVAGIAAFFLLLLFAGLLGAGALLLMMTGLTGRTIDGIRQQPFSSIGMGVVVLFGLFAIAVLLCITVIGIPLAFVIFWLYPILILLGFIVAVLGVPYLVLRRDPRNTGAAAKLGIFFVSLLLLLVLFSIPGIGQIMFFLFMLMGVGAFGAAVLGRRNAQTV